MFKEINPVFTRIAKMRDFSESMGKIEYQYYLDTLSQTNTLPDPFCIKLKEIFSKQSFNAWCLAYTISVLKHSTQVLTSFQYQCMGMNDEDIFILADLFADLQCPKHLGFNFSQSALSGQSLVNLARVLRDHPQKEGSLKINFSKTRCQKDWDLGVEALAELLTSGACPPHFSINIKANKISAHAAEKLFNALSHAQCPETIELKLSGQVFTPLWSREAFMGYVLEQQGCLHLKLDLRDVFGGLPQVNREMFKWLMHTIELIQAPKTFTLVFGNHFFDYQATLEIKMRLRDLVKANSAIFISSAYLSEGSFKRRLNFKQHDSVAFEIAFYNARNLALAARPEDLFFIQAMFERLMACKEALICSALDDAGRRFNDRLIIHFLCDLFTQKAQEINPQYLLYLNDDLLAAQVPRILAKVFHQVQHHPKKLSLDCRACHCHPNALLMLLQQLKKDPYPRTTLLSIRPNLMHSCLDLNLTHFIKEVALYFDALELLLDSMTHQDNYMAFVIEQVLQIESGPQKLILNLSYNEIADLSLAHINHILAKSTHQAKGKELKLILGNLSANVAFPRGTDPTKLAQLIHFLENMSFAGNLWVVCDYYEWGENTSEFLRMKQRIAQLFYQRPNLILELKKPSYGTEQETSFAFYPLHAHPQASSLSHAPRMD